MNNQSKSLVDVVISAENPEAIFKEVDIPINFVDTSEAGVYYGQIKLSDSKYGQIKRYFDELDYLRVNQDYDKNQNPGRKTLIIEELKKDHSEFVPGYKFRDF